MNEPYFDVIVAGFGTAGSVAALAAARAGASVLALERTHYAGGTHTGGFIPYYYLQKPVGLMVEIDRRAAETMPDTASVGLAESKKHELEIMALELGIKIVYGAAVTGVIRDGDRVTGVRYAHRRQVDEAYAHTVIDATGDAVVCKLAGAELRGGRYTDGVFMPFTNSMAKQQKSGRVTGYNIDAGRIDQYREPEFSQTMLDTAMVHLHEDYSEFRDLLIPSDLPGVREGLNIVPEGRMLNLADVLDGDGRVDEPIGYVWSNLDTHANDMPLESILFQDWMIGASMWGIPLWFPVPRNAMHPKGVRGVLAAGRHLGVGHELVCALRMNPLMGMLGETAGNLAAIAAKRGIDATEVPYADIVDKLYLTAEAEEYDKALWALSPDEVRAALDSDGPGVAMWSARRNLDAALLREWYDQAQAGSRLRRHAAMTLALKGDAYGADELRAMVRERDAFAPTHSRKYNHCRGYVSLYLLGRLADAESISIAEAVLHDGTIAEHRYEYHTHALMALVRIGDKHPKERERIAGILRSVLEDREWQISSRLKGTGGAMKRMDAIFRCAGAIALNKWGIPHRIGEALLAAAPDDYELDLARRHALI